MAQVVAEVTVAVPVQRLYSLAKGVERFPEFMPDLEQVEVLERDGPRARTRWVGRVREFNRLIRWVEEDEWDDAGRECHFRQTEGDFDKYEGVWRFRPDGQGAKAHLQIDYEFNVPLIGALIKRVVQKLMQHNCEQMLAALKALAEQGEKGA